jgi:hypothetical protein
LDKLILYDPKAKKISLETVQKVVSVEAHEDLFRFSDALLAGDVQEAFFADAENRISQYPCAGCDCFGSHGTLRIVCICVSAQEKGEKCRNDCKRLRLAFLCRKKSLEAQKYFSVADAKKSLVVLWIGRKNQDGQAAESEFCAGSLDAKHQSAYVSALGGWSRVRIALHTGKTVFDDHDTAND